jgi:hypothetical protein
MRSRNRASSTAEICQLERAAQFREGSVDLRAGWRQGGGKLFQRGAWPHGIFDDFRHQVQPGLGLRRDFLEGGVAVGLGDAVLAQALGEVLGVAHRLDAGGVHRLHLLDEAEDAVQLLALRRLLVSGASSMRASSAMRRTWSRLRDMV